VGTLRFSVAETEAGSRLDAIAQALKGADTLVLATDPDREGEAISWHVLEVLRSRGALNGVSDRVLFPGAASADRLLRDHGIH